MSWFFEQVRSALLALKASPLRSFFTVFTIAIGVFTLIATKTAIQTLDNSINSVISSMGSQVIRVNYLPSVRFSDGDEYRNRKTITLKQANDLQDAFEGEMRVGMSSATWGKSVQYFSRNTQRENRFYGVNHDYFSVLNLEMQEGRVISEEDVMFSRAVVILGLDVANALFVDESAVGKDVKIDNKSYRVIGVAKSRGSAVGQSMDKYVMVPITYFVNVLGYTGRTRTIDMYVEAPSEELIPEAVDEITGAMRGIRNIQPGDENDFEVETNESVIDQFAGFIDNLEMIGLVCGLMALLAAGIGIMNIMLVIVRERTREIGVRKAVGATRAAVLMQFLIEAVVVCQIGALAGISTGIPAGNLAMNMLIDVETAIPVEWVIGSGLICTVIGVTFGLWPAWKAARLAPVDALSFD